MFDRRILLGMIVSGTVLALAGLAFAKNEHHNNGHDLLGAKLNQNGKHEIGKIGSNSVLAEVNNKKVVNMSAGSLAVRKVKSNKKMAGSESEQIKIAAAGEIRIAQAADVYYGYCVDSGVDVYCYWYPASDVIVTDTWVVYTP